LRGGVDKLVALFKLLRNGVLDLPVELCHEIVLRVFTGLPDEYVVHTSPSPLRVAQEIYGRGLELTTIPDMHKRVEVGTEHYREDTPHGFIVLQINDTSLCRNVPRSM
jgi:hypothetical protein